jgi:putative phosphoribosyl transferase
MNPATAQDILIPAAPGVEVEGRLVMPAGCRLVVVFAHGSGSSRHSSRNQYVARVLNEGSLGTLLFDLLTPAEERLEARTGELRFNIPFLAARLVAVTDWLALHLETAALSIGYFGASTGGGAALMAAAERGDRVAAVVSRGGRPDLAADALRLVHAPTLMIVGGHDEPVVEMNRWAMERMKCPVELAIVPGATHLFEEPGALDQVAELARRWFQEHQRV